MATVYVVNEPLKRNADGRLDRQFDLSHAMTFGELVKVLPAGPVANDPDWVTGECKRVLKDATADDYLLLCGDPGAIATCGAVMAKNTGGMIKALRWHPRFKRYEKIEIRV